jgi:hypothetical protein
MLDRGTSAKNWEPRTSKTSTVFSYAILLGGAITIGVAVYMVMVSYSILPFWDGWMQIGVVARGENPLSVAWLWKQYDVHRVVIPKLFLLVDLRWFRATQVFLLVCNLLIQFLHLLLWGWSMRVLGGWRGALWRTGVGLVAFCMFCCSQWMSFVQGFQISSLLPGLFATLSFVGLLLYWVHCGHQSNQGACWKYLLLSIAAALGATYSQSNGNLLWPLLVGAALLLRLRRAAVLSFAIAGIVNIAAYLYKYTHPAPSILSSLETPVPSLKYLAAYFGSPWVRSNIRTAELIGIVGVIAFLIALPRLPFYVRARRPLHVLLALTLLFCFGTGLLTALKRINFGTVQAFSSRYQTVSLLFWCCMALLLLSKLSSLSKFHLLARIIHEGTESGSLGGVCALRMVVAA